MTRGRVGGCGRRSGCSEPSAGGRRSATHRTFAAQAAAVRAGGADLAGLGAAYPPLPTLPAGLVPGGAPGLSVVAGASGHRTSARLAAVALVQPGPAWVWPPTSPGVADWPVALT